MAIEDISGFIAEVAVHFAPPKYDTANERDAWLRSIQIALKGSSPSVLARAAQIIIDTRKNRYFPMVAELREAIRHAADDLRFDENMETLPTLRQSLGDEWSTERIKLAYDLIKSGMGKQAARDNPCWVLGLWHFCRKNQRLPDHRETERIRRDAQEFDQSYRDCLSGKAGPFSQSLERLGASVLTKREKLCAEVLGR